MSRISTRGCSDPAQGWRAAGSPKAAGSSGTRSHQPSLFIGTISGDIKSPPAVNGCVPGSIALTTAFFVIAPSSEA
ncbi:MAG: hypothetical protein OXF00_00005, partial [bacterium]|nr:hypothetical protein [bacterium]